MEKELLNKLDELGLWINIDYGQAYWNEPGSFELQIGQSNKSTPMMDIKCPTYECVIQEINTFIDKRSE